MHLYSLQGVFYLNNPASDPLKQTTGLSLFNLICIIAFCGWLSIHAALQWHPDPVLHIWQMYTWPLPVRTPGQQWLSKQTEEQVWLKNVAPLIQCYTRVGQNATYILHLHMFPQYYFFKWIRYLWANNVQPSKFLRDISITTTTQSFSQTDDVRASNFDLDHLVFYGKWNTGQGWMVFWTPFVSLDFLLAPSLKYTFLFFVLR